jgi:hypothetical protein
MTLVSPTSGNMATEYLIERDDAAKPVFDGLVICDHFPPPRLASRKRTFFLTVSDELAIVITVGLSLRLLFMLPFHLFLCAFFPCYASLCLDLQSPGLFCNLPLSDTFPFSSLSCAFLSLLLLLFPSSCHISCLCSSVPHLLASILCQSLCLLSKPSLSHSSHSFPSSSSQNPHLALLIRKT